MDKVFKTLGATSHSLNEREEKYAGETIVR